MFAFVNPSAFAGGHGDMCIVARFRAAVVQAPASERELVATEWLRNMGEKCSIAKLVEIGSNRANWMGVADGPMIAAEIDGLMEIKIATSDISEFADEDDEFADEDDEFADEDDEFADEDDEFADQDDEFADEDDEVFEKDDEDFFEELENEEKMDALDPEEDFSGNETEKMTDEQIQALQELPEA